MSEGIAQQVDVPIGIYNRPKTRFIAEFVARLNVIEAETVEPGNGTVRIDDTVIELRPPMPPCLVTLAIRPEGIALGGGGEGAIRFSGPVDHINFMRPVIRIQTRLGQVPILLDVFNRTDRDPPLLGRTYEYADSPAEIVSI